MCLPYTSINVPENNKKRLTDNQKILLISVKEKFPLKQAATALPLPPVGRLAFVFALRIATQFPSSCKLFCI